MIKSVFYITLVFCLFATFVNAQQNLVPNGSFEEQSSCPTANDLGDGQFERCNDWWYPTSSSIGTSDYFCSCNNNIGGANQGIVGVPNNFWGHQEAFDGTCYLGIVLFDYYLGTNEVRAREMVSTRLNEPLKWCAEYELSFWLSFAENSSHSIDEIQFHLSTENEYYNSLDEIPKENVFTIPLTEVDTSNWINARHRFTASGKEQYLTIGHFTDVDTNVLFFNDSTLIHVFNSFGTYFYIDSVSIRFIEEKDDCFPQVSNVFSPNGDHVNDLFSIIGTGISEMHILNRWGNIIAPLNQDNPVWDGTSNGIECAEGTYFYRANYNDTDITGFIQLVR